jgi:5'-nucleotidase
VLILLTNDDGVYAPGLAALERQLRRLGELCVVAPATEQSGVGHSITYLTPLIVKEVFHGRRRWGWAVEGSPADCVKLGITELCPRRPDLIVSGINGGLNAGINVLYSGTVAAAIEGAFSELPVWPSRWSTTSMPSSTRPPDWPGTPSARSSKRRAPSRNSTT